MDRHTQRLRRTDIISYAQRSQFCSKVAERVLLTAVLSYPSKSHKPAPRLVFTPFVALTCFTLFHTIPVPNVGRNEGRNETTYI